MAQAQILQIKLSRFDAQPWGFRLQGGVDFATPLVVQKVNGGSLAEKAGLIPGDAVLKINDVDVFNLRHKDAQDVVVRSGNNFVLTVQRGGSTWRPHVTPTGNIPQPQQNSPYLQTVTKTSLAHKQQESQHIGCGYNNAARPFANGGDGNVKSIVNKQYNTPVGIYSDESIAETLSAQAEVLAGGVLGVNFKKNEKEYQADKSEVLKFLREEETGSSTPEPPAPANFYWTQSHAIGGNERRTPLSYKHQQPAQLEQPQDESMGTKLQENDLASNAAQRPSLTPSANPASSESVDPRVIIMPVCPALQGPEYKAEMDAAADALHRGDGPRPLSASGHPACALCGVGIAGVFVRIKDKNLHVECFKCATCGTSLKNQGYYNYNNKLYCDIHAKLAALQNPPAGTDGYVPVPIKPNTKLSANTISSALNIHGFSDIPVANGGSAAAPSPSAPTAQSPEGIQEIKEEHADLPLPPPPSPTSLQQLGLDNVVKFKQEPNSPATSSTASNSSSVLSAGHPSQIEVMVEGTIDERSGGYASTSPLNSRQTSSSLSSMYGNSSDNNAVTLIANAPPPPPPLPPSCQQRVRQQNENDMNSKNQFEGGVDVDALRSMSHDSLVEQSGGGKHSLTGGVYSKFLKEYSNKLLTLNKHNNNNNTYSNTNILNDDISLNINANNNNTNHSPNKQSPQIPGQVPPQSPQISDSTAFGATKTHSSQHSGVAALSSAFANQLKFNPCQQVEKPAATAAPPPPAASASVPTAQATTAISSTIPNNNKSSSNNNSESGQFEGATQGIHDKATYFPSTMLANSSPALGTASNDQPFGEYVTLTGSVIRSVVPPGKGANINYKVNQGYARPFGAASAAAPKSPVAYPPQRPAVNPYATLPRTNIGQQGRRVNTYNNFTNNYSAQFKKPVATNYGSNKYATMPVYNSQYNNYYNQDSDASLQPQYAEECNSKSAPAGVEYFEKGHELAEVIRQTRSNFLWPPQKEDSPIIPTAAPLYIPPPETQHVVAKPSKVSHLPKEDEVTNKQSLNEPEIKESEQEQQAKQYLRSNRQSKSAPHLTIGLQPPEIESSSESFTSTSTTTTTTSEEYQRMYAAQVQAYQTQQMYEQQSGSELDYHMDMEVATMQQNPQDYSCVSASEYICGRRSAQECVESLVAPLNTYKLIDMVREVTPSPVPPPNFQGNRHVMFMDEPETKEITLDDEENIKSQALISSNSMVTSSSVEETLQESECAVNNMKSFEKKSKNSETFVKTQRTEVCEDQRIFPPTSEIKIEIAPVRQIPPSKIPNPVPKEWINPMVRVLTTAPDVPFHLVECPCPKPCDGNSFEPSEGDEVSQEIVKTEDTKNIVDTKEILTVEETPPKGSWLASAITTAPEWEVRFEPPPSEIIPLPEETEPYMPPPIDMKPYMREDYRPKSPFLSALTTAPERPFEGHFERDVPIHLLDLPTPKEHLTLSDALCTAPERAYTPLNPENATNVFEEHEMEKRKKKSEFQVLNREEELGIQALDKLCTKPTNANATLPHKVNSRMNRNIADAHQSDTDLQADGKATAMLTESIGLINAGDKMDNFMAEAGKIISNMLETRLANNNSTMPTSSHGGSTSSLRSNCSSNQSRSPMVIRKRFDLVDFKNIDPTVPVALKPVLTVSQQPQKTTGFDRCALNCQKTDPQMAKKEPSSVRAMDVSTSHPMGKLLGICDINVQGRTSPSQTVSIPLHTQPFKTGDTTKSTQEYTVTGCQLNDIPSANQPQDVVYREKPSEPLRQCSSQREGELSTHELDRRSYIEPTDLNVSESAREGPAFSIHVRALGPKLNNSEGLPSTIMPPENEDVVSQLLRDGKRPICCQCNLEITKGPFITALGRIWCPEHFICVNANCRRPLQDIGFVEEKGDLYCEYCFEKYLAPSCCKCGVKIKGDCLNAIGKQFHPECFTCGHCGKLFGNTPFFLEDGNAYCEADWNELFTTKCFACGFPVEAGDRWVEALNHNYHSQCFNCTYCKQNLEGQSFYNKGGRPFCKNHAR